MRVEDMAAVTADIAGAMAGMLSDMPRPGILRGVMLVLLCAAAVAMVMQGLRAAMGAMQGARIMQLAAAAGEVVPGTRTLDIPGSAITARATAIRMEAIMVTDPVGAMIHITGIVLADNILTDTGTRLIWASASVATKLNQRH